MSDAADLLDDWRNRRAKSLGTFALISRALEYLLAREAERETAALPPRAPQHGDRVRVTVPSGVYEGKYLRGADEFGAHTVLADRDKYSRVFGALASVEVLEAAPKRVVRDGVSVPVGSLGLPTVPASTTEQVARAYHRWTWPSWDWEDDAGKRESAYAFAREALVAAPARDLDDDNAGEADRHALLRRYSEWLDGQGVIKPDDGDDQRSHDDLVGDYLATLEDAP